MAPRLGWKIRNSENSDFRIIRSDSDWSHGADSDKRFGRTRRARARACAGFRRREQRTQRVPRPRRWRRAREDFRRTRRCPHRLPMSSALSGAPGRGFGERKADAGPHATCSAPTLAARARTYGNAPLTPGHAPPMSHAALPLLTGYRSVRLHAEKCLRGLTETDCSSSPPATRRTRGPLAPARGIGRRARAPNESWAIARAGFDGRRWRRKARQSSRHPPRRLEGSAQGQGEYCRARRQCASCECACSS